MKLISALLATLLLLESSAFAETNYHLVGWFNTFVPGGGQMLLGNYGRGASQAAMELGTFGWGYSMSKRSPLTLDGVPEDLPVAQTGVGYTKKTVRVCTHINGATKKCDTFKNQTVNETTTYLDRTEIDDSRAAYAMTLQELGIKLHFVNVYEAYRMAARDAGAIPSADTPREPGEQRIDETPVTDLFLQPFKAENMLNPWVWIPLVIVAGATVYDYKSQIHSSTLTPLQPMTAQTNRMIAFNYVVWEPIGSGAPEEMFYRGFLQNEFYSWVRSPYFSIPLSAAAFSFSHGASGRVGAAIAGTYLGFLSHYHGGNLGPGIAMHFWSVVLLGLETFILTRRAQGLTSAPVTAEISFPF